MKYGKCVRKNKAQVEREKQMSRQRFAEKSTMFGVAQAFVVLRLWASVVMGEMTVESEVP